MFKSKSFRINHEIDKKPKVHDLCYESKRIRWMKFLIIPLIIAFSLLLVLSNVNFSGESYEHTVTPSSGSHTKVTQTPTKEVATVANIDQGLAMEEAGLDTTKSYDEVEKGSGAVDVAVQYLNEAQAKVTGVQCTDNNTCKTVVCKGGPIYTLQYEFDYFLDWCENKYFDVIIENCTFNKSTIDRSTFSGSFKMSTLTIRNCTLDTIVDNAFNYQTLNKLTNLTFVGTQLKALNEQTFLGLETVENFQLINVLKQETLPLNASNFLQPMAPSLSNLVLQQTEGSCCSNTIYDPTEWLGGNSATIYSKLTYVDLSGTNFNDTLNGNTFAKLSAVQELRMANCSLSTIAENVFTGILSTLKSLDLRYNRLQTLDGEFLAAAIPKGINMELGWNMWRCDCDNMETIEYMKQIKNNSAADTVCATPTDLAGTQVSSSQISCYITTIPTTILTTITTTAAPTTTAPTTATITDETILATKETSADTIPTSSTIAIDSTTLTASDSTPSIVPTTVDDKTEETAESSSETLPTTSTTIIGNSTLKTSATTEETDVSESTDTTLVSTIVTTISTTTPKYTTINTSAGTTSETVTPPSSQMTSTTEDSSSKETSEPISTTTTPQLTDTTNENTTLTFFTGTITIPITTDDATEGTVNPEHTTEIVINTTLTWSTIVPTTIIPPTNSCYGNKAPKYLPCSNIIAFKLCDYDVTFNVVPISSRSVQLQFGGGANSLHLIYFQVIDNSIRKEVEIENNSEIIINNLAPNGSYTFCLIPKNETSTSPFNCRSAHLPQLEAWLEYNDVALFCTIAILVTVVCAVIGVTATYFLLRWRPTLLYGNKRLHRIASTTHEVLLLPKPNRTSLDSKTYALSELSKMHSSVSDSLTPENYLNINSYDYMQYVKDIELMKQRKVPHISTNQPPVHRAPPTPDQNINSYDYMQYVKDIELKKQRRVPHISMNQPPVHRAPALPPNVGGATLNSHTSGYIPIRHPSHLSAVVMEDAPQQQSIRRGAPAKLPPEPVDVVENEYESLDYYQEIY
ncbi:uncharacterized protein LOC126755675 [Bactrocera neohumeralis]|uniref:uncharacterized protein LOC126755675 n=1 Tax=Bactrocera neohumeralis TaxID=98809 RepID=UPI0021664FCB|nr:uncharacterized protein LOC126755675 [Bactrocera neohumeralis]